jgi:hypothetical protein
MNQMIFCTAMILSLLGIASSNTDKRHLLLFTQKNTIMAEKQLEIWNAEKVGMEERDLTFKVVIGNELLYKKYKVDKQTDFTLILVGKDGSEKLRTYNLLTAKKLFALIDAMPMRRDEMRNKGRNQ